MKIVFALMVDHLEHYGRKKQLKYSYTGNLLSSVYQCSIEDIFKVMPFSSIIPILKTS